MLEETLKNRKLLIKNSNPNLKIILNPNLKSDLIKFPCKQESEYNDQDEYGNHHEYGLVQDIPTLKDELYFVKGFRIFEDIIISFDDSGAEPVEIHLKSDKDDHSKAYNVCFCNVNIFSQVEIKSSGSIDVLSNIENIQFKLINDDSVNNLVVNYIAPE